MDSDDEEYRHWYYSKEEVDKRKAVTDAILKGMDDRRNRKDWKPKRKKKKNPQPKIKTFFKEIMNDDGYPMKHCEYEPLVGYPVYRPPKYQIPNDRLIPNYHCMDCGLKPCITEGFEQEAYDLRRRLVHNEGVSTTEAHHEVLDFWTEKHRLLMKKRKSKKNKPTKCMLHVAGYRYGPSDVEEDSSSSEEECFDEDDPNVLSKLFGKDWKGSDEQTSPMKDHVDPSGDLCDTDDDDFPLYSQHSNGDEHGMELRDGDEEDDDVPLSPLNKNHADSTLGGPCKPDEEDSFVLLTQDTRHIRTTSFIKITSTSKASANTKKIEITKTKKAHGKTSRKKIAAQALKPRKTHKKEEELPEFTFSEALILGDLEYEMLRDSSDDDSCLVSFARPSIGRLLATDSDSDAE